MLSSTNLYQLKKAKNRKITIILSQIFRDYGADTGHLNSIINTQINRILKTQNNVRHQVDIDDEHFAECLKLIEGYTFQYMDKHYGHIEISRQNAEVCSLKDWGGKVERDGSQPDNRIKADEKI